MTKAGGVAAMLAAAAVAAAAPPVAAVPPPTPISQNTTWTKAESPIHAGSVHVLPNVMLTIEPGVQVVMDPGGSLLVSGSLRAQGTAAEPIVFTAESSWRGIEFLEEMNALISLIRHARVENAQIGILMGALPALVEDTFFTGNDVALRVEDPDDDVSLRRNQFYSNGTAFSGTTSLMVGIYDSDFWDNDVSMSFEAFDPYACETDHGVYDVHGNDILRGPDAEWYSYDVRTSSESGETDMRVLASDNWWGTTNAWSIRGRMEPEGNCCPVPERTRVKWEEPATAPQTDAQPPGPIGDPPVGDDIHGDIDYYVDMQYPAWGDCLPARSVDRIVGVVRPVIGQVPDEIESVALVKGAQRCKSYDPEVGFVETPCDEPIELTLPVRDDDRFVLKLRRPLRPGRYTAYAGYFGRDFSKFRVLRKGS